jgi:potassium-transporting ATPase potassium-binding subunit
MLIPNAACLLPDRLAVIPPALSNPVLGNNGPHGLSEILYFFGEAANNNGSAFAGLNANVPFYNVAGAIAIWIGRFVPIIAALAIVGGLAAKKTVEPPRARCPPTAGRSALRWRASSPLSPR